MALLKPRLYFGKGHDLPDFTTKPLVPSRFINVVVIVYWKPDPLKMAKTFGLVNLSLDIQTSFRRYFGVYF